VNVAIDGRSLSLEQVAAVARDGAAASLGAAVEARMIEARAVVERSLARGDAIYGASTAVGVLKRVAVGEAPAAAAYASRMIAQHRVAQGPPASDDVVRATMLLLANGFASGWLGVRPALAERLVEALNAGTVPSVRTLGSVGQADLAQMADLAAGVFAEVPLEAGEGLALLGSNAYSTAAAALAVIDAKSVVSAMVSSGALSLEALAANPGLLHPAIAAARPYPGIAEALAGLRNALEGSFLWAPGRARNLQDPLSFRNLPQIHGAVLDGFHALEGVLAVELNASQGNPIVVLDEDRLVSVANYEVLPLAAALDSFRIVLGVAFGALSERVVKLLEAPWSGLTTGLRASADESDPGLGYLGIACQSIAAEARLLAAPVSLELVSTAHAEGIEDRTALAGLGARRLADMVGLGRRLVALELVVGAQAVELRGLVPLGDGTSKVLALVRSVVPFLAAGDTVPNVEPLVDLLAANALPGRAA
jgi:histidine ammonia-lyase